MSALTRAARGLLGRVREAKPGSTARRDALSQLRQFLYQRGWLDVLAESGGASHTYDYTKPFEHNVDSPPARDDSVEGFAPSWSLLGREVAYPLGVAASPLTANSEWISSFASRGFNVLTYKTVRSSKWPAHPAPNWIFLDNLRDPLPLGTDLGATIARGDGGSYPAEFKAYSMANSFGLPSRSPEDWQPDVARTLELLGAGQLLIVSIVGSAEGEELATDFGRVAVLAEEAGAGALELNLSCPNTLADAGKGMMPPLFESPKDAARIVGAVREKLQRRDTKVVAKLGYMPPQRLAEVVAGIADLVDGISGINTLPLRVVNQKNEPVFVGSAADPSRPREVAGISGIAIRDLALDFVSNLARLRKDRGWTFDIIGMGGVMSGHDVRALMASGADAVQSATAAANNPDLPADVLAGRLTDADEQLLDELKERIASSDWEFRTTEGLGRELGMEPAHVRRLLSAHPEIARPSQLRDRHGVPTWTSPQRPVTLYERLADFRAVLARE